MKNYALITAATIACGFAMPLHAAIQYHSSYTVNVNLGKDVTNIMLLEQTAGGGSSTWAFTANGNGSTTIDNPFPTDEPTVSSLLIGEVENLPTDDESMPQKHIVLFMDDTAAQLSNHIAFGTLFGTSASGNPITEEDLLANLELATSGQDWPIITPGLDAVNNFANDNAVNGILGPGGVARSAWFATGGSFTLVAWSDGSIIGTGESVVTSEEVADTPEPASLGCLVMGVGALALRRRR